MNKKIEILEIKKDDSLGFIVGCHASEWDGMDEAEIQQWFEGKKKLEFANGSVLEFSRVMPFSSTCFGRGRGQAVLSVSETPGIAVKTPTTAVVTNH